MKNIAVVAGGYSGEHVISLKSAAVVKKNIDPSLYKVYLIEINHSGWFYLSDDGQKIPVDKNDFSLNISDGKILFDAVFIIIHGTPGEDGLLQGYFEMLKIPYTTCDAITSALTFNKFFCNQVVRTSGLVNVSPSVRLVAGECFDEKAIASQVGFPCFVKPNAGGSSIGTSKVKRPEELKNAIEIAFKEDCQVLVERFVEGRELTCGVVKLGGTLTAFPITEIISKKEFFDYEAKYDGKFSDEITPAEIDSLLSDQIQQVSKSLYNILNCFGVVRFDYIYTPSGELYFLEVNTVPGQSEASIVPQQARAHGWTVMQLYTALIEESLSRK